MFWFSEKTKLMICPRPWTTRVWDITSGSWWVSKEYFFTDDPKEYFAECYSMYVLHSDYLEKRGYNTFKFIQGIVNKRNASMSDSDYLIKMKYNLTIILVQRTFERFLQVLQRSFRFIT